MSEPRKTADTITDDLLDALYAHAEQADAVTAETKRLMERRTATLRERAVRAEAAIERVRALHLKYEDSEHCQHDGEQWPCPTLAALDEPTT
ncbi:hypothetical protein ACFWY6_12755 [Streptomyces sp. NPDC059037]|uniref:hypothetical protein n=1 Tax=Streptomyces sp. NPDC059037 TaxID=3346710 RepID=UPI0036CE5DE1